MTTFSDPNREAVGLPPAGASSSSSSSDEAFDPGAHTVAEVEEYLAAHPDETEEILDLERTGKARVSLVGGDEEP